MEVFHQIVRVGRIVLIALAVIFFLMVWLVQPVQTYVLAQTTKLVVYALSILVPIGILIVVFSALGGKSFTRRHKD